ncbi:hypothetical protein V6W59_11050 [Mannheimia sp. HC-2023]|uniref:hypothetical protein n=1 Tax=Mannheimia indoligenes TaxID=3103145 RepID=UPI002FE5DB01
MSNTIQKLKSFLTTNQPALSDKEIELWVELYALTRQQQQFALAVLPLLQTLSPDLAAQAQQIIALDTLLRRTKGKLLTYVAHIKNPTLRHTLLEIIQQ